MKKNNNKNLQLDEREVIYNVLTRLRNNLKNNFNFVDYEKIDTEIFKFILETTSYPPTKYFQIFTYFPEEMQKNILKYLKYNNIETFKKELNKFIVSYYSLKYYYYNRKKDCLEN